MLPRQTSLTLAELRAPSATAPNAPSASMPTCRVQALDKPAFCGERIAPHPAGDAAMLYLHGGGCVIGSPRSHRHLVADLA